jgi:hypothetical protein
LNGTARSRRADSIRWTQHVASEQVTNAVVGFKPFVAFILAII